MYIFTFIVASRQEVLMGVHTPGAKVSKADRLYTNVAQDAEAMGIVTDFELAETIIRRLLQDQCFRSKPSQIIERASYSKFSMRLLATLIESYKDDELVHMFLCALMRLNRDNWNSFDPKKVGELLNPWIDFRFLAANCPSVLCDATHPMFGCLNASRYWVNCVIRSVANDNPHRAFDELKDAMAGIRIKGQPLYEADKRYCAIDRGLASTLVRKLYRYLYCRGFAPGIPNTTFYHLRFRRISGDTWVPIAGLGLAEKYFLVRQGSGKGFKQEPSGFLSEGGKFLTMARMFSDYKNKSKRRK